MDEIDDDIPQLNPSTLAALNEFYQEKLERENEFKAALEKNTNKNYKIDFEEDWQLSQFWYDEKTIANFVKVAVQCTFNNSNIALISCPTIYKELISVAGKRQVKIFEFDKRFSIFGSDFIFYDYNKPRHIPEHLIGIFDLVICDPPFLSEECLSKISETIKLLAKKHIILCTGAVMEELASELLGIKKCYFEPKHKNNLANEFWCYSNFDVDQYLT